MVTGGASGIGLQIAQDLAARGAALCILDRNADAARNAAASLEAAGALAQAYVVDLADAEATRQTLAQALNQVGTIDILVNNAGIVATVPATDRPFISQGAARTMPRPRQLSVLTSVDCPPLALASCGCFGAALGTLAREPLTTVALRVRPRYVRRSGGSGRS